MPRDYYEVLGISKDSSKEQIRKAFKRLAMKYHPDRQSGQDDTTERFREAKEAHDVLNDDRKREMYDRFGHEGVRAAQSGQGGNASAAGFNFGDIFGDVFGDIFGGGQRSRQGRDVRVALEIDFKESVFGVTKPIKLNIKRACKRCDGKGAEPGSSPQTCPSCDGRGQVHVEQGFFTIRQPCNRCQGRGSIISKPCRDCSGGGSSKQTRELSVKIPAGIEDGSRIRLSNEGESAGPGSAAGHLYVDIHVRPHPVFSRSGDDLHCNIDVPFTTAALGGPFEVETLTGNSKVTIQPGTQSDKVLRLRNKGVSNMNTQQTGSLYCRVRITVPTRINKEQSRLFKELESSLKRKKSLFG